MLPFLATVAFLASPPTLRSTPEDRLLATYRPLVGTQEKPVGSNRGAMVDTFNRAAKTDLGAPWCASVAVWGHQQVGLPHGNAYSPSWYVKSKVVPPSQVRPGDMALVWFPSKGRYAHTVACVEQVRRSEVVCLEGNTNSQGSREGHGFFRRIRPINGLTFVRWR